MYPGSELMYSSTSQLVASSLILVGLAFFFGTIIIGPFKLLSPVLKAFNPALLEKIEEESHRTRISPDQHPISVYGHIFTVFGVILMLLGLVILFV